MQKKPEEGCRRRQTRGMFKTIPEVEIELAPPSPNIWFPANRIEHDKFLSGP